MNYKTVALFYEKKIIFFAKSHSQKREKLKFYY